MAVESRASGGQRFSAHIVVQALLHARRRLPQQRPANADARVRVARKNPKIALEIVLKLNLHDLARARNEVAEGHAGVGLRLWQAKAGKWITCAGREY